MKLMLVLSLTAVALTVVPAAQGGSTQPVTLGSRPADITLTVGQPPEIGNPDNTILVHLEGLINRSPAGSEIDLTVFRMTDDGRIEEALKAARRRNVAVHIVNDPSDTNDWDDWCLNGVCKPPSTRRECSDGCLSSDIHGVDNKMHAKFALFSSTKRAGSTTPTKAVWVSSSNLNAGSGTERYNDAVTYYGESEMYTRLGKVFNDMSFGPVVSTDYYRPELEEGAGHWIAEDANTVAHVSPERQTNIWYDRLLQIKAPNEGGGPCTVRVMQAFFGDDLLDPDAHDGNPFHTPVVELIDLKRRGCTVQVLGNEDDLGWHIGPDTENLLCDENIPVRYHEFIHNKLVITSSGLWYGPAAAATNYPMVYTGSHNMTKNALRNNDELLTHMYGSQRTYDLYNNYFVTAWNESWALC